MNNMRTLRKRRKLTMKELGKAVGVSESTISLYETGKHEPDIATMQRIADVLGVSVDMLIGRRPSADPEMNPDIDSLFHSDESIYLVARGMQKMSEDERYRVLQLAKAVFPEAFTEEERK